MDRVTNCKAVDEMVPDPVPSTVCSVRYAPNVRITAEYSGDK